MRTYFFGDLHGNAEALEACLRHMDRVRPDAALCLGDLVGWLPFGDRTLTRMRELDLPTVAGNHDLLVAGALTDFPEQIDRMQASAYNAGLLSTVPGAVEYLLSLPLSLEEKDFAVVHHSPFHLPSPGRVPTIHSFHYLDSRALGESLDLWRGYSRRLIFSGHDHDPAVFELSDGAEPRLENVKVYSPPPSGNLTISLKSGARYWVKGGSVGGPYRDGIPAANSVLYDSEAETVTLFRVPYPTRRLMEELTSHPFHRNLPTMKKYIELLSSTATDLSGPEPPREPS
ncbi:MAG TPA: metallophosphoesterase family protein [Syntrophobacteraceae bacterium]|nr:metallophosphoesterase family protein [Syntrophobacteraceae bacterium]